ncbi:chemotaxis protein CheY [Robbsia andropogonis]|uniref:Chemotaxis protein CheY n=1 Tax=Robbsia andropogonis TaxID=28092 RepID=A0A0F5JWS9_9BURK|nr:response regulator transcription factor [Robbsia andropogonis]KKB62074.1 chemotaxis protein CheY [Robbsia andropogonis]MCP1117410.1 response regulator transcription factor [Robbsia andropogonis]MCP1126876.1 response regulator transcription factor [Robbsia andropogonis]
MKKISVGLADDHPIILLGVTQVLTQHSDIDVQFSCSSIGDLFQHLSDTPVDVLLCDFEFADDAQADGVDLLKRIKRVAPNTKVVILSSHTGSHIVSTSLAAGASGFIGKARSDCANLPHAIREVQSGSIYLPGSIASAVLSNIFQGVDKATGLSALSEKESIVARMTCDGFSISEIAARIHRSPKTVSNQKGAAMRKLGARNDVELASIMRELKRD